MSRAVERAVAELAEDLQKVIVLTVRLYGDDDYRHIARKLYDAGWRKGTPAGTNEFPAGVPTFKERGI